MVSLKIDSVKKICAILGIVEGILWIVMCFAYIILYSTKNKMESVDYESAGHYIHARFFQTARELESQDSFKSMTTLISSLFHVFVWLHLFFNIAWVASSLFVLFVKEQVILLIKIWFVITFTVFFWDAITSFILMDDHRVCLDKSRSDSIGAPSVTDVATIFCRKGIIPVLIIASKGCFLLWILNGFFALHLIVAVYKNASYPLTFFEN